MAPASQPSPAGPVAASLTIGELATEAGVTPELLRTWEARHGFPFGERTPAGHRRFVPADAQRVRDVLALRATGLSLDRAIKRVLAEGDGQSRSVFAELRRSLPQLRTERMRGDTLVALSRAIEDESCALARRPVLVGAFQVEESYRRSEKRWRDLSGTALFTLVLADFGKQRSLRQHAGPSLVQLGEAEPMRREWTVVCVAEDFHAALAAWEQPGQVGRRGDREFEAVWTTDPRAARSAARLCLDLAGTTGVEVPDEAVAILEGEGGPPRVDAVESLAMRAMGYLDRLQAGRR